MSTTIVIAARGTLGLWGQVQCDRADKVHLKVCLEAYIDGAWVTKDCSSDTWLAPSWEFGFFAAVPNRATKVRSVINGQAYADNAGTYVLIGDHTDRSTALLLGGKAGA